MPENVSPLAGKTGRVSHAGQRAAIGDGIFHRQADPSSCRNAVVFGTSGHRGSAFDNAFNEAHILAISQAICSPPESKRRHRPAVRRHRHHALSEPAVATALEVFAANDVDVMIDERGGYTPTPVISHAILTYNKTRKTGLADGVVITPSHNPPQDGGFKYNPPNGGPADTDVTGWTSAPQTRCSENNLDGLRRIPYGRARQSPCVHRHDYISPYVADWRMSSTWKRSARRV